MNYIVYKTTNLVNGKIYIGVHKTDITKDDGYRGCGVSKKCKQKTRKTGFPAAFRKYGFKNFKREILFIYPCTKAGEKAAYEKEAELVTPEFVKRDDNYNLVPGGKFTIYTKLKKKIAQYTLDGKFIRYWDSISEASNALGLTAIHSCVTGRSKYCGKWLWKYAIDKSPIPPIKTKELTVYQFDLSGNLLKVWKSVSEASKNFDNQNAARSNIRNCCIGVNTQSYGYYWSYKHIFNFDAKRSLRNATPVACYTDAGIFVKSYSSINEAAKELNINSGGISAAISGKAKHCKGYRWRLFYGNSNNIKPIR